MPITSINIADIGHPDTADGDPGCPRFAQLWIPDQTQFPGPYHCFVGTHAADFSGGGLDTLQRPFGDAAIGLASVGFLCLAFQCRLTTPIPGQTTNGKYHLQTDDCKVAVKYMRPGGPIETIHQFSVSGFVGTLGGSGSAHHALYMALDGTEGVDKSDAAICMSPVTDFGDRTPGPHMSQHFIDAVTRYGNSTDLAILTSESPISLDLTHAKPILHYNGDDESMPQSQLDRFAAAMLASGATGYESHLDTGSPFGRQHAFAIWPFIAAENGIPWALARAADFVNGGGGGPPPPPPPPPPPGGTNLLPYTMWLTSTLQGATGTVPLIPGTATSAIITNLTENAPYTCHLIANNEFGSSKEAKADFIAGKGLPGPPPPGTLKPQPNGLYALIDMPTGVLPAGVDTAPFWTEPEIDGVVYHTNWTVIQPTKTAANFSDIDSFLAICVAKNKKGAIIIDSGIKTPAWVLGGSTPVTFLNPPDAGTMPMPWDVSNKFFLKMILQLGATYDTHPELAYVAITNLGRLTDTLLTATDSDATLADANAVVAGYADAATGWEAALSLIAQQFVKAFRTTNTIINVQDVFQSTYVPTGILDQGLKQILGVPNNPRQTSIGLLYRHLDDTTTNAIVPAFEVQINAPVRAAGFEFAASTGAADAILFDDTLTAGINLDAKFINIFQDDASSADTDYVAARISASNILRSRAPAP